jgi:hypothetical protein
MYQTRHKVYNTLLRDEIEDLEDALKERQTMRRDQTLAKVQSLAQLSRITESQDHTSTEMLRIMSRQQDLIGDMVKTIQNLQPRFNLPASGVEYGFPQPKTTERPVEKQQISKEEILKDLDIESNEEEEDFIDKEQQIRFSPMMSDKEKAEIYDKIRSQKPSREKMDVRRKISGVRRFRALVWGLLFPIFS